MLKAARRRRQQHHAQVTVCLLCGFTRAEGGSFFQIGIVLEAISALLDRGLTPWKEQPAKLPDTPEPC